MTPLRRGPFRAIDLFCGCGGLTLGLIVAAGDNDPLSVKTYKQNNPIGKVDAEAVMTT